MSVSYLFVGGPSHGKLVVWRERVPAILVPSVEPARGSFGHVSEDTTPPEPSMVWRREVYRTERVLAEITEDGRERYGIDVAFHSSVPAADSSQFAVLDNQRLLLDAMIQHMPGATVEPGTRGHDW